jgi:hypothetical protein
MVEDVISGDRLNLVCLNCARRSVVPKSSSDRFNSLTRYLRFRASFTDTVKLSFARIDGIIGENLPIVAYRDEGWWSNAQGNVHSRGWLNAGWDVQEVNLKEACVVFRKVREVPTQRNVYGKIEKPFTPVPVRRLRSKVPSKTKVSKLYARVKNIEKQRANLPQYRGLGMKRQSGRRLIDPEKS